MKETKMRNRVSESDQEYLMGTAIMEVVIAHDLNFDDVRTFKGVSGAWYIVSKAKKANGVPEKIYLKKTFNNN